MTVFGDAACSISNRGRELEPAGGFERSIRRLRFGSSAIELHRLTNSSKRFPTFVLYTVSLMAFNLRAYQKLLIFRKSLNMGLGTFPATPRCSPSFRAILPLSVRGM